MLRVNWVQKPLTPTWRHTQRLLSILLLTATTTACFPSVTIPSAVAQQKPKPPAETKRISRNSVLDAILKLLQRKQAPLASRPVDNLCAITPGLLGEKNVIWSDRPLFIWQGTVQRLEVRPYSLYSPYSSQEVLWNQTVTVADRSATYTSKALQPGQTYDWELVVNPPSPRNPRPNNPRYTFQVMEAQGRDRITAELTALEKQLKGETAEAIALERANYFAERDLWSDALQEVFSVKNPSAELTRTAQEISTYLCGQ